MATVRFSQELKDDIINNAKLLFSKRLQTTVENPPDIGDEVADRIFKDFMPLMLQVPKQFFTWTDTLDIDSINGRTYGKRFKLKKAVPSARDTMTLPNARLMSFYSFNVKLIGDEWNDIQTQIDNWIGSIAAVEQERNKFVDGVKTVINTYSTLAPALKAWPPLWDLVPDAAKERHRKVVERAKPEVAEVEVDLTALTGIVTAAKFAK
jgi:hypothetical protein